LLARQLRISLAQIVTRQIEHNAQHFSLESLDTFISEDDDNPADEPADYEWEDRCIAAVDNSRESQRFHRLYPTLAKNVLDGLTQAEIAQELGIGHATVERRIAKEKHQFLIDSVMSRGLKMEGDETDDELQEAYEFLNHNRDERL
jgi:hypothetical protein